MSDAQQEALGKEVKFGLGQLSNPTPVWAKQIFRGVLYLSALWAVASPYITEMGPITLATINKYLLLGNAIINVTIKFYGWDFKH